MIRSRRRRNPCTGCAEEVLQVGERRPRSTGGSGGRAGRSAPARAPTVRSPRAAARPGQRGGVEGERLACRAAGPGTRLASSKGCSGWWTSTWSRTGAAAVRSRASSSSPSGHGGGSLGAVVLAAPGVGDHQRLGGRRDRVEQQLAVLRAQVALAGAGSPGQHVVAVDGGGAREDPVVEADQADHAVRHRAHRHHRADRQGAGAEVGARRPAAEPLLQEGPHVGLPQQGVPVGGPVGDPRRAPGRTARPARRRPARSP